MSSTTPSFRHSWNNFFIEIVRFYECAPIGKNGNFFGTLLTAWYMLKGSVEVSAGGLESQAKEGDWLIRMPGERYHKFSPDAEILSIHICIHSLHNAAQWQGPKLVQFHKNEEIMHAVDRIRRSKLIQEMNIKKEFDPTHATSDLKTYLLFQELVIVFFRLLLERLAASGTTFEPPVIHDERVRQGYYELVNNPRFIEPFSRSEFASSYGLSPSRLDRLWKKELGMTPTNFMEKIKLEHAQTLLHLQKTPIKEISYKLGFNHLSHFSLWFKNNTGESPRHFRQRHKHSD
ncbi:helix-turn-helix transcriptional regulator [Cerasicoccus fimbriatus]|uniref:helix-turn-helix transcriptional regulator n=1 Tax=Cerasicoccus fimbriatus TaxID=3014554 RepID=UPI0022B3A0B5|nr:AraC family transcriptional regulator [Cerasicoccus sp. TK19100]